MRTYAVASILAAWCLNNTADGLVQQPVARFFPAISHRSGDRAASRSVAIINCRTAACSTALGVIFEEKQTNGQSADPYRSKDEALMQAQSAISSLESALESAVSNLDNMQAQLQLQVVSLENELEATKEELESTRTALEEVTSEMLQTQKEYSQLQLAYDQTLDRANNLESYINQMNEETPPQESKKMENPWQLWTNTKASIPILNEWIAIKGANEGEVQISGKVTSHPVIPDGDAIVTSPVKDPKNTMEGKIITTLSGSKYRLGDPMSMPSSETPSQKVGSSRRRKPLTRVRSSVSLPDLSGKTIGNGKFLLAGDAVSSVNGRSYIQTAYKASPLNKPVGNPLIVKFSSNIDAMKREYVNYEKVSRSLKRGSFIRRVDFLGNAGDEMPNMSALVMQRGVADVKAFMPKIGGKLEGELLLDCALSALKCMESLHSVKLVWNDLKTENFVVIEDERGGISFRGIDLESCMPLRSCPIDYTPEACPPEFAACFMRGDAETFQLDYSYDVWSYGMFLYEIATGRGFFDGSSAQSITKQLPSFVPHVDGVQDLVLADLISRCLSKNPKDRPTVAQISKHEFFASANKNPFDFLFG